MLVSKVICTRCESENIAEAEENVNTKSKDKDGQYIILKDLVFYSCVDCGYEWTPKKSMKRIWDAIML